MDPVTLVVAALVAGLTAGVTDTAKTAIADLYSALKARLQKNAEGKEEAQAALASLEKKPESEARQAVLKEELAGLQVEKDGELLALAKQIMEKLDDEGTKAGKYNITIGSAQGVVIGDHAKVEQHFGEKSGKK